MVRTEPFKNMAEVSLELRRLDAIRKGHEDRLERHWQALLDHDVRGRLLKDAANDVIRSWKPTRMLNSIFGGGSLGGSLMAAVGVRGGWFKRAALFGLNMALPKILGKVNDLSVSDIAREMRTSYERFREHMEERKKARAHSAEDDDE